VKYAKIIDGQVAEYPYTFVKLRTDNPAVSFPSAPSNELLAEYGVYPVTLTEKPAPTLTQNAVEQPPQLIEGVWTQVWGMVDVSAEEAAKRQIRADAFVQNFIAMTPAQVTAYVEGNTNNITEVRALLNKMALMLLALARREYR
jgi:hypothetical protein